MHGRSCGKTVISSVAVVVEVSITSKRFWQSLLLFVADEHIAGGLAGVHPRPSVLSGPVEIGRVFDPLLQPSPTPLPGRPPVNMSLNGLEMSKPQYRSLNLRGTG